ncbi:MAG: CoB--CoM heterodisulfide reductase iron-sulfur subunit A family protein [Bacteroidetes bacterium]|nr:CoB--CoM heterodisulfide reductase iron-sulfur subunit A family protein [Bacteroidota bacterium]MBU1720300.1 CoB--CoM heterodisulfide reductase iron-sulfur subunit A family protein [Bacteroidota bacterium]
MKQKIGVYICQCGSNISDYVNVEEVAAQAEKIEGVALAKTTMFACADSTQKEIEEDIKSRQLDAIVVASCSPKLHLFTFRNVAIRAGLNPFNYVQVNVREQCSWAHSNNPKQATEKAIHLVIAGIERVKHSKALPAIKISADNAVLVVGAGVSGMRAAIELAKMGTEVVLIEKNHFVGGRVSQWNKLFITDETGQEVVARLYQEVKNHNKIKLFTGTELISKSGGVGNFDIQIQFTPRYVLTTCKPDWEKIQKAISLCPIEVDDDFNFGLTKRKAIYKNFPSELPHIPAIDIVNCNKCGECVKVCEEVDLEQQVEKLNFRVGAILLTTGADSYEPKKGEFAYQEIDNVITLQQFKRLIEISGKELLYHGKKIRNIAFIYCVGSRQQDGENKYCSRYCCTSVIHSAILVKEKYEGIFNFHFTRGVRTYGKQEILYNKAAKQGDIFLQSFEDSPTEVTSENGKTIVKINDILTANMEIEVEADLVVLVTGMVPRENTAISSLLKIPIGRDKFYNEVHPKLRPVETVIDGILIAGTCQSPKTIMESVNSALSAAAKANSLLRTGEIELEPTLAVIDKETCDWCDACAAVCPYDAIEKSEVNGKFVAQIAKANCKGCGMCLPVCPVNAIQLDGYTDVEMEGMISALVS